jgi:hypothetical protein
MEEHGSAQDEKASGIPSDYYFSLARQLLINSLIFSILPVVSTVKP